MRASSMTGQSSVEFAVSLSALFLILAGTLTISAWQETQRRTLGAARQAAFEVLWTGADDATRAERVYRQQFGDYGLAMPLTGQRLVELDNTATEAVAQPLSGATASVEELLLQSLRAADSPVEGEFSPGGRGWVGARMAVQPKPMRFLPGPLGTSELHVEGSMLLLNDGWSADGPEHVAQRAGTLVPTHRLALLGDVI
ncbi:MAG: pilus assembly protein, partial [Nevskiaceae bacterium]|nr:pilus assembly protein [Nevskiaceae bacterium]